uniref:Uncharacterized protein n=1 Tax=Dulem virus 172 TaxID=3145649 RepID=A0AAU8AYW2_9VIRU
MAVVSLNLPKYYDKLFDVDSPFELDELKANRLSVAEMNKINKLKQFNDVDYEEFLRIQEENLKIRLGHVNERSL